MCWYVCISVFVAQYCHPYLRMSIIPPPVCSSRCGTQVTTLSIHKDRATMRQGQIYRYTGRRCLDCDFLDCRLFLYTYRKFKYPKSHRK